MHFQYQIAGQLIKKDSYIQQLAYRYINCQQIKIKVRDMSIKIQFQKMWIKRLGQPTMQNSNNMNEHPESRQSGAHPYRFQLHLFNKEMNQSFKQVINHVGDDGIELQNNLFMLPLQKTINISVNINMKENLHQASQPNKSPKSSNAALPNTHTYHLQIIIPENQLSIFKPKANPNLNPSTNSTTEHLFQGSKALTTQDGIYNITFQYRVNKYTNQLAFAGIFHGYLSNQGQDYSSFFRIKEKKVPVNVSHAQENQKGFTKYKYSQKMDPGHDKKKLQLNQPHVEHNKSQTSKLQSESRKIQKILNHHLTRQEIKLYQGPCKNRNLFSFLDVKTQQKRPFSLVQPFYGQINQ